MFNYKKSKFEKLKGFCLVVENEDSIAKASKKSSQTPSTISKQISSLEQDLGYKLFDRIKNKLYLNEKGKEYYKIAKNILLDLEKAYSPTLENIDKSSIEKVLRRKKVEKLKKKVEICLNVVNKVINRMLVSITPKRVVSTLFIILISVFYYLYSTNYFFDQKLKKLANPLLREVMEVGSYRIPEVKKCPKETMQIDLDVNVLLEKIASDLKSAVVISIQEMPFTSLRMSGEEKVDSLFNSDEIIKCDRENNYLAYRLQSDFYRNFFLKNNFNFYNFFKKDDCLNCNIFFDNVKQFSLNLHPIKMNVDNIELHFGKHWILKSQNYYYLIVANAAQSHNMNKAKERHLIFKKLTLDQLKTFDNGSYWKLIKEYNIRID